MVSVAKLDFRGLIPGKRYKIVIHPETVYGTLKSLPTIDFVVPEAPPRARGFKLDIRARYKPVIIGYTDRKFRVYKWKIVSATEADGIDILQFPYVGVVITGNGTFRKNRIKPGDKITISGTTYAPKTSGSSGNFYPLNVTGRKVINRQNTPKNRVRIPLSSIPSEGSSTGFYLNTWYTSAADDGTTSSNFPLTHVKGGAAIIEKIPYLRIRIPKSIHENLMWSETVRDFVHIVYRTGKSKATVHGKRKYLITDTDIDRTAPIQDGSSTFDIDDATYPNGHPPVFVKEIRDKKYYQFEFIVARYIRYQNSDGSYTSWTGSWIEQTGSFNNKLSRPSGWKA